MRKSFRIVVVASMAIVAASLCSCFKETVGYTNYRIAVYNQATKEDKFSKATDIEAYAYYVDTTYWAVKSYEDAVARRITHKQTGEVREVPDVFGELNTSDTYQMSVIINQKISMMVIVNPDLKLYAYRKYELPQNLPMVDTKLYMSGWKPSQAASGWRVINQFYQK